MEVNSKRIDRLFLQFAAFYGQLWKSQFKNDDFLNFTKREWQKGLLAIDDKIVEAAVIVCRENLAYPPTLPQFIDTCRKLRLSKTCYVRPQSHSVVSEIGEATLYTIKQILKR